ncbi:MAG TPA: ABC transporter ATP-binding protein [Nitrospirae bacterium]|nr:ABC transporter ATP-binding protein [Nitrospirota bacterium]HDK81777.1 ABC transporter ATP-binding protein [Nitrospirota bacterium]
MTMTDKNDLVIDVEGLKKSFKGKPAVNGVSLKVRRGDIFGFLGPNGSGKTTTIRMICGLLTPDAGHGRCLGHDLLTEAGRIKQNTGYMTQRFSLYEDLTVRENLDFIARMYGVLHRKETVDECLTTIGLKDQQDKLAGTLSGGWQQRLALAACLVHKPGLLLLDEPTAGVDPRARCDFWDRIHELSSEGTTTLVSTHYMDEAEHCNKLAYIVSGELLTEGSPEEIVKESGLVTWIVTGPDIWPLARELSGLPGVAHVAAFGASLHVSGYDEAALREGLKPFIDAKHRFEFSKPGLEDVFICLMKQAGAGRMR